MQALVTTIMSVRRFSLRRWFSTKVEKLCARIVAWCFSKHAVQKAFIKQVDCRTPIGRALNEQIENTAEMDASNIQGLNSEIESVVEDQLREFTVDADDVKDLDNAVSSLLEDADIPARNITNLDDEIEEHISKMAGEVDDDLVKLVAQRLSY